MLLAVMYVVHQLVQERRETATSASCLFAIAVVLAPVLISLPMVFGRYTVSNDNRTASRVMKKIEALDGARQNTERRCLVLSSDLSNGQRTPTLVVRLFPFVLAWAEQSGGGGSGQTALAVTMFCAHRTKDLLTDEDPTGGGEKDDEAGRKKDGYVVGTLCKNPEKSYTWYNLANTTLWRSTFDTTPDSDQMRIVADVLKTFGETKKCTAFVEGPPGTGKSTIVDILCMKLVDMGHKTVVRCPIDPSLAGHSFTQALSQISDNPDTVVVFCIDEVDVVLNKIRNNRAECNPNTATLATDKKGWNAFLDDLAKLSNTITVMTSNTSKAVLDREELRTHPLTRVFRWIRRMPDEVASNLRPGRVGLTAVCGAKRVSASS